jgi:hypothetical protein
VEWYAVKEPVAEMQREDSGVKTPEVRTMLKGEAGWIAC